MASKPEEVDQCLKMGLVDYTYSIQEEEYARYWDTVKDLMQVDSEEGSEGAIG